MQFSSKPPFNDDLGPWVSEVTGSRYWERPKYGHGQFRYEPRHDRPQTNPTNRILDEIRSEATDMADEMRMIWNSAYYSDRTLAEREHAYKVLRKWKGVYGEED